MEPGGPLGDIGVGERLTPGSIDTSLPRDIILDSTSDIGTGLGAARRFDANLDAIRTLKILDTEDRQATPEEQATLAKYSGFGDSAFNDAFSRYSRDDIWKQRGDRLRELTSGEEYEAIERSRLNAFYTTPEVINATWQALRKMGADDIANPHILEPSAGSGRFLGFQPVDLAARSQRTAVELDQLTGRMLKQMYPKTEVYVMGYQDAPIPKESVDIAISNVPFGDFPVHDRTFGKDRRKLTRQIHNYFFAKTLDQLRPGGLLAFVTSHGTLDSTKAKPIREALAEQADLVGAIRLPKTAFPDTEVVTDIVFMRKRLPTDTPGDKSWVETGEIEREVESDYRNYTTTFNVNKYFIDNPDMVLGKQTAGGSMYRGAEYTVEPDEQPLSTGLAKAINRMPESIIKDAPRSMSPRSMPLSSGGNVYEGSRVVMGEDDSIYIKKQGELVKANLTADEQARVRAMLGIRDAARAALNTQLRDGTDDEVEASQGRLNTAYDEFVVSNGALNATRNTDLMGGDPDGPFLRALEEWSPETAKKMQKVAVIEADKVDELKMPLFSQRTVRGLGEQHDVASNSDAVIVSLNETGRLDFNRMGELLGKDANVVQEELAEQRLIYKNPIGEWEPADQYLSGDVREKLRTAEAAATAKPAFNVNVEALRDVQPADLPPSQIGVRLGAPWVPSEDINEFVTQLVDAYKGYRHQGNYFKYVPETGEWVKDDRVEASEAKMYSEWGTGRMGANEIIHRLLNGKLIQVNDKDANDNPVRNPAETVAAQEKATAIQAAFKEWIWNDPDRASRLAKYYNDTFNTYRPRRFDGTHQALPGMIEGWAKKIHPHQKDAIWRVVQDRTSLLAHEVGFGKTAVMVGAGMELRRLGLSRKNLYVVPKATHGQFEKQFRELYPYANILFPSDDDFTPERRPEFISRAVTGDWDAIILADTQFRRIPIKPETEVAFLRREVEDFRSALEAEEDAARDQYGRRSGKKSASHKEIQKALIRLEERLAEKQSKVGQVAEHTMHFEDMGTDQMFIDEADNFKNLRFATKMGKLKGLPNTDSDRAWDMYQKTRYLQDQKKGGVVFATGTPVANTIAEMYTMMRYLQNPMLEAKGLQHFDAWAKTFGETTESLEQTPTGAYKLTQRFSKFQNAPELSNIWQQTTDIRVAGESPHVVRLRPRLVDEEGKARRSVISAPPDQQLLDYMQSLSKRADELGGKDPREDNMLKIASDARMASLDMRMVDPGARQNPEGKVVIASKKIAEIYQETEADRGTQLVFLDLGTPKAKEKIREEDVSDSSEEYSETAEEEQVLRNVYKVMKEHLIDAGVPVGDIAFIHDAKNNKQREVLQKKVNNGDIRVIIGSTGKMGVGVNVQKRAAALHHLDAPWRPRDIEQREGRIVRQGNEIYGPQFNEEGEITDPGPGVKIYTYVTERSFDAYMWQAVEAKSKAIKAIMRRDNPPRNIEDIDSFTMSAGEAKAVASGNPDVLKSVTLKNDVTRLQMLRESHTDAKVRAREQLRAIPKQIDQLLNNIASMEQDAKLAEVEAPFTISVKGKVYSERTPAGETLKDIIANTPETATPGDTPEVGLYKGFDVRVVNQGPGAGYKLILRNPATGYEYATTSILGSELTAVGALQRIDNKIAGISSALERAKIELQRSEGNLSTYQAQAESPFEYESRLEKMEAELARLEKKLQGQEVGEAIEYEELNGEPLNGEKALYKFTPREPEPEVEKPKSVQAKEPKAQEKTYEKYEDDVIDNIETAPVTPEPAPPAQVAEVEAPKPVAPEVIKEPWQMTREESATDVRVRVEKQLRPPETWQEQTQGHAARSIHKSEVQQALASGKPVPPEVLKDYPDLAKATPKAEISIPESIGGTRLRTFHRRMPVTKAIKPKAEAGMPVAPIEEKPTGPMIAEIKAEVSKPEEEARPYPMSGKERRKAVLESRIRRGESVPKKLLTEFPELQAKPPKAEAKKPETKVKPKVTSIGPVTDLSNLLAVHNARSNRARATDETRKHSITIASDSPKVKTWIKNQGNADIKGVDTPRLKITLKPDNEPKRNRSPRGPLSQHNPARKKTRSQLKAYDLGGGIEQTRKGRHLRL